MLDVHVCGGCKLDPRNVACCKFGGVIEVADEENLTVTIGVILKLGNALADRAVIALRFLGRLKNMLGVFGDLFGFPKQPLPLLRLS